ncbi:MAG: radical SAM protein, partial [Thaumarchaeota archaeon]|nr:radical SAM protein [Nitrososphaerota archaeon]
WHGRSVGVNNIPPKVCSYSCVYCQLGSALHQQVERKRFYSTKRIFREVSDKVKRVREKQERIDFLTFVPDGEPTLDVNLGEEIESLKTFGLRIAVLSNSSLVWREDVKEDLMKADWISLKVDSVDNSFWKTVNRPEHSLKLQRILDGIRDFSRDYKGELTTETMLVDGINDKEEEIRHVAGFLREIDPDKAYVAIPTRPPAEAWVWPPSESILNTAYQIFKENLGCVELLTGYEGSEFVSTGNVEEDLLGIAAVHPIRRDGVERLLSTADATWNTVEKLISENKLKEVEYQGKKYYLKRPRHIRIQ